MTNQSKLERAVDAFIAEQAEKLSEYAEEQDRARFNQAPDKGVEMIIKVASVSRREGAIAGANSLKPLLLKALEELNDAVHKDEYGVRKGSPQHECKTLTEILALLGSKEIE